MQFGYTVWGTARWALGSTVGGVSYSPGNATITFEGFAPSIVYTFPASRISWIGVEVVYDNNSQGRVTWMGAEVVYDDNSEGRMTWMGVEVVRSIASVLQDDGGISILW